MDEFFYHILFTSQSNFKLINHFLYQNQRVKKNVLLMYL